MLEAPSEEVEPSAGSIDSQSVKKSKPQLTTEIPDGPKTTGQQQNIAVDRLGLVLAVSVTTAMQIWTYGLGGYPDRLLDRSIWDRRSATAEQNG